MKNFFILLSVALLLSSCSQTDSLSLLKSKCMSCHNLVPICAKIGVKDFKAWQDTIDVMNKAGAKVSDSDKEKIAKYLSGLKSDTATFCK